MASENRPDYEKLALHEFKQQSPELTKAAGILCKLIEDENLEKLNEIIDKDNCDARLDHIALITVLIVAARSNSKNSPAIVDLVLQKGANVNKRDRCGKSALHYAAFGCNTENVRTLIKYGADVNALSTRGNTAIIEVTQNTYDPESVAAVVKLLLEAGANPFVRNNKGETALDIANENNLTEAAKLLQSAGESDFCSVTSPVGLCLIININNYNLDSGFDRRTGSEYDVSRVKAEFGELGFEVMVKEDLKAGEILDFLFDIKLSFDKDRNTYGAFVCFLMGYCDSSKIFCRDGTSQNLQYLAELFSAKNCSSLKGKPKIFFVEAQADDRQGGLSVDADRKSISLRFDPPEADFLFCTNGLLSRFQDLRLRGTPWIQILCDVIDEINDSMDLSEILTEVDKRLKGDSSIQETDPTYPLKVSNKLSCSMELLRPIGLQKQPSSICKGDPPIKDQTHQQRKEEKMLRSNESIMKNDTRHRVEKLQQQKQQLEEQLKNLETEDQKQHKQFQQRQKELQQQQNQVEQQLQNQEELMQNLMPMTLADKQLQPLKPTSNDANPIDQTRQQQEEQQNESFRDEACGEDSQQDLEVAHQQNIMDQLYKACNDGDAKTLKSLTAERIKNFESKREESLLQIATALLNDRGAACVGILLNLGANLRVSDNDGCTPMHYAALGDSVATIRLLANQELSVNCADNEGDVPAMLSDCSKPAIIFCFAELLVDLQQEVSDGWKLIEVIRNRDKKAAELWEKATQQYQQLSDQKLNESQEAKRIHDLVTRGDVNGLQEIVNDVNCNVRYEGKTAIMRAVEAAAEEKSIKCVQLLVNAGANVHATDVCGRTCCHMAAELDEADALKELIKAGADADQCDFNGRTPLLVALLSDRKAAAKLLMTQSCVRIDRCDADGLCPRKCENFRELYSEAMKILNQKAQDAAAAAAANANAADEHEPEAAGADETPRKVVADCMDEGSVVEPPDIPGHDDCLYGDFERCYLLNLNRVGKCVVLNNERYIKRSGLLERRGSAVDTVTIRALFQGLGLVVQVKQDLKSNLLSQFMYRTAGDQMLSDSLFVCFLLGHGTNEGFYGTDGELRSINEDLLREFQSERCQNLNFKPKLFFIQACRTMTVDSAQQHQHQQQQQQEQQQQQQNQNPMADFLIARACHPGSVALRDQDNGTPFVNVVCDVIEKSHSNHTFQQMIVSFDERIQNLRVNFNNQNINVGPPDFTENHLRCHCWLSRNDNTSAAARAASIASAAAITISAAAAYAGKYSVDYAALLPPDYLDSLRQSIDFARRVLRHIRDNHGPGVQLVAGAASKAVESANVALDSGKSWSDRGIASTEAYAEVREAVDNYTGFIELIVNNNQSTALAIKAAKATVRAENANASEAFREAQFYLAAATETLEDFQELRGNFDRAIDYLIQVIDPSENEYAERD